MARTTGVRARHSRACPATDGGRCKCSPSYEASVYDLRGVKVRRTFPTFAAASDWRTDAMHDRRRGKFRAPTGKTFDELADEFVAGMRDGTIRNRHKRPYKPSAIRSYESAFANSLRPEFGPMRLDRIEHLHMQDFVDRLVAKGLAGQTVRNIVVPAQAAFTRAAKRENILNPTRGLDLPAVDGRRDRVAGPQEAAELIDALKQPLDRALWALFFYSGARWGEAAALQLENVSLDAGTIAVVASWDKTEGFVAPKSEAGTRIVPLCGHLREHLAPYIDTLGRKTGFVFAGRKRTTAMNYDARRQAARTAWKRAGLSPLTPHDCRHSFRSYLDAIPAISEIRADRYAGHASSHALRARYTHAFESQMAADAAALDEYLSARASGKIIPIVKEEAA